MRILRLEIERFMGLRRVNLDVNPSLQLIAGPNNAGKTTLFRALEFFFNPDGFSIEDVKPQNSYYSREGRRALTRVRIYVGEFSQEDRDSISDAILRRSGHAWAEVRMSRKGTLSFEASGRMSGRDLHTQIVDAHQLIHVPAVRVDRAAPGTADTERLSSTIRDVLVRTRRGRQTAAQQQFERRAQALLRVVSSVLESSRGSITELVPGGQDIGFRMPELGELLEAAMSRVEIMPQAGTEIRLRDEGTGIQSLLSLGILKHAADANRGVAKLFLIEEPEAFLHPQLQRTVSQHLTAIASASQVIATTHSAILVDAVDLRCVCRLKRDPDGLQYSWRPAHLTNSLAGQLSRFCDAKNSELVFAKRVILCEGPSDVGAIETLLGESVRTTDTSVVATGGATNASMVVRLARHFNIPHLVVLDKDQIVGDRTTVRQIAIAAGLPFSQDEIDELDQSAAGRCASRRQAAAWRGRVQPLLEPRGIYCLGNDLEGAIISSYPTPLLLDWLGPNHLDHLSQESVNECLPLQGHRQLSRLRQLVGSKGWNNEQAQKANKLKPHVPRALIGTLGNPRVGSDLAGLRERLRQFIDQNS